MILTTKAMLVALRGGLDKVFAPDTAVDGGWNPLIPASGHCAVVAMLVRNTLGGEYASATISGVSHWFNRLSIGARWFDVDLTGDQFGRDVVQVLPAGMIYGGARARAFIDLNSETIARYELLRARLP